eukprot:scaffold91061_cov64-Phaeocystis_antarctica.AAC.1
MAASSAARLRAHSSRSSEGSVLPLWSTCTGILSVFCALTPAAVSATQQSSACRGLRDRMARRAGDVLFCV